MSILICGSLAYDTIMVYPGRFRDHILADQAHMLNVAFLVPRLHRHFGGCAGNIAYSLKLLGANPLPMATVGHDFEDYRRHLDEMGIDRRHVRIIDEAWTAQAYITTDVDDNQITAFHPGAMEHGHRNQVEAADGIAWGIVSPDSKQAMLEHGTQFSRAGIPHIFDPGQGLPMFSGEELRQCIAHAAWLTVNDYEFQMLSRKTGWTVSALVEHIDAVVITRGGEGSTLITRDGETHIEPVTPGRIKDPTGCGDAYRAGLLYGLEQGWAPADACRLGSLLGSIKIETRGPQNHRFDLAEIRQQYRQAFGSNLPAAATTA